MSAFEISGNGKELANALSQLSGTIPSRATLPILYCAALRIESASITASVTNLDAMHTIALPVAVRSGNDGAGCCVALSMFVALLAKFGESEVTIRATKDAFKITGGSKSATIQTLPLDQFPTTLESTTEEKGTINGPALASAIRSVAFAQSKDSTRYILNGIYFDGGGNIVATTGHILATIHVGAEVSPIFGIIPSAAISPILGILDRQPEVVIFDGDSELQIKSSSECYLTKKIDGNYPQWQQVMPRYTSPDRFTFDRDAMKAALQFANIYTDMRREHVMLKSHDGNIVVSITNPEIGDFSDSVPLIDAPESKMFAAVKVEYLAKVLAHGVSDLVAFEVEPSSDGAVLGPLLFEDKSANWKAVIMTCRPA